MRKGKQGWLLAGAVLGVALASYCFGYTQGASRPEGRPDASRPSASAEPRDGDRGGDGYAGGSSGAPADGNPVVVPSGVPAHQRENVVRIVEKLRACLAEADAAYERDARKQALDAYELALFIEEAYPYRTESLLAANDLVLSRARRRVVELRQSLR